MIYKPSEARKRFLRKAILSFMTELVPEIGSETEKLINNLGLECEKPRRDETPCYYCDNCYKRWEAERRIGVENDLAVNKIMAMYEELERE